MGEILLSKTLNPNYTKQVINVSALSNGIYHYAVENNKHKWITENWLF